MRTFDTPEPIRLRVTVSSGELTVTATDTTQTTVELTADSDDEVARDLLAQTRIEHHDREVVIATPRHFRVLFGRKPQLQLTVTVPTGSELEIRAESADLEARGEFGAVTLQSGSGDVRLDTVAGEARIRTGSGEVTIERAEDSLRAETGSGDIDLHEVLGDASISTGSGDVSIDRAAGDLNVNSASGDVVVHSSRAGVSANTASGDLQLLRVERGRVRANSASGDVHVGVATGTAAYLDISTLSGSVHSDLDGTSEPAEHEQFVQLQVNTVSGDIALVHA